MAQADDEVVGLGPAIHEALLIDMVTDVIERRSKLVGRPLRRHVAIFRPNARRRILQGTRRGRLQASHRRANHERAELREQVNMSWANRHSSGPDGNQRDFIDDYMKSCFLFTNRQSNDALRRFLRRLVSLSVYRWIVRGLPWLRVTSRRRNVFAAAPRAKTARIARQPRSIRRPSHEPPRRHCFRSESKPTALPSDSPTSESSAWVRYFM